MASYHFSISDDRYGSNKRVFLVNPLDITGMFPDRAYTVLYTLDGNPIIQFPSKDTQLRSFRFDIIPDENVAHRQFLIGINENDSDSLLYLKRIDQNGALITYYLTIPEELRHLRPYGYRNSEYIPIRIEDVRTIPETDRGKVRWVGEIRFRIVNE